jgi:hypothetical protein
MPLTRNPSGRRIRMRCDMYGHWIWELVSADGHVAQRSEPFPDRPTCQLDALRQDVPLESLSRALRELRKTARREEVGPLLIFYEAAAGPWWWERVNKTGRVVERSERTFSTRDDCIADARLCRHLSQVSLHLSDDTLLARIPRQYIAEALKTLPNAEKTALDVMEVSIDVPNLGAIRITVKRTKHKLGKSMHYFWTAGSAALAPSSVT